MIGKRIDKPLGYRGVTFNAGRTEDILPNRVVSPIGFFVGLALGPGIEATLDFVEDSFLQPYLGDCEIKEGVERVEVERRMSGIFDNCKSGLMKSSFNFGEELNDELDVLELLLKEPQDAEEETRGETDGAIWLEDILREVASAEQKKDTVKDALLRLGISEAEKI